MIINGNAKKNTIKYKIGINLFFNIFGIIIIFLNPFLKEIPIKLAEWMAELSIKNKFIPIIYLILIFFALPFIIILTGR